MNRSLLLAVGAAFALCACDVGSGTVVFTVYGEDYIEEKIPAENGDETGFVDGWELAFTKFLVTLSEITVATRSGEVGAKQSGAKVFDVHQKGPVTVETFAGLDAKAFDDVSFSIAPVADAVAGNASAADVAALKTSGHGVYVEATATKDAVTKTIRWGFPQNTQYLKCTNEDIGDGVVVPNGGEETVQLTIHGDHFFYDNLQSDEAQMRFQAIADADANSDGEVTLEELAQVDLTTLPLDQYGTGGAAAVHNLRQFVEALSRTLGHYRGEGECEPHAR